MSKNHKSLNRLSRRERRWSSRMRRMERNLSRNRRGPGVMGAIILRSRTSLRIHNRIGRKILVNALNHRRRQETSDE
jgi:hypothetical protein